MSTPSAHFQFQYNELNELERQLTVMRRWGVLPTDPGYLRLWRARGTAMGKLGLVQPRTTTLIKAIIGLSPGELKLWSDAELGWMVEVRTKPGAPPVYRYIGDDTAEKVVKGELTHEEFTELSRPITHVGV